jgi:hypothetical protein
MKNSVKPAVSPAARLAQVRTQMRDLSLTGLIVFGPAKDFAQLQMLTGFDGNLGTQAVAIISPDRTAIFCYPGYVKSVAAQPFFSGHENVSCTIAEEVFQAINLSPVQWLQDNVNTDGRVGYVLSPGTAGNPDLMLLEQLGTGALEFLLWPFYLTLDGKLSPARV